MNTNNKYTGRIFYLAALLFTALVTGCSGNNSAAPAPEPSAAPTVTVTSPADTATGVALNNKVTATFSEAMDATTIDTVSFTVTGAGESALTGTVSLDAATNTASFTPGSNITASKLYTATLTTSVTNSSGTALADDYVWSFTSGTTPDTVAPTVNSTNPADTATNVALNQSVSANFSEALDPATVNSTTFTLSDGATPVTGTVSYSNNVATFTSTSELTASTIYTATLTSAITDLAANPLAANSMWTFTTGTLTAAGPAAVNLRTAASFAILSKTGITTADGSATITGNIGSSPIAGADNSVVCGEFAGYKIFTDDATYADATCVDPDKTAASLAIADVLTAYTNASAPATPAGVGPFLELGAGTVTAQALVPGVYTWAGNVSITGEITLDGNANDVWIFQIGGTLDTDQTITLASWSPNAYSR